MATITRTSRPAPARGGVRSRRVVTNTPLGRVLDPEALASAEGARARASIEVPASFLDAGASIELTAPARLTCARCDGGGCDGCSRSGALRAPESPADRTLRARLPQGVAGPVMIRIPDPFGPNSPIRQLFLEVRRAAEASAGVRRVADPLEISRERSSSRAVVAARWSAPALVAALLAAAAIAAALLQR
jgi:hypothetical protein